MNQSLNSSIRIAFIQSSWHRDIVDQGRVSFLDHIARHGIAAENVEVFTVPGAFEIPLHAQLLARSERFHAIVGCGFVVNGGVYRHDFVAQAVINGLMQVQLATEVPVFSMVLTPHHFHEHEQHQRFFRDHFITKGAEAAIACAATLQSLARIRGMSQAAVPTAA